MKTSRTRSKRRDQTIKVNIVRQTKTQALSYIWNVFTFLRKPVSSLRRNRFLEVMGWIWREWRQFSRHVEAKHTWNCHWKTKEILKEMRKDRLNLRHSFFKIWEKILFKDNKLKHITSCRISLEFNDISCVCYDFHESIGLVTACGPVPLFFSFIDYKTSSMNCNFWSVETT